MAKEKVALYRKYRPDDFENLVGQEHIKTSILNAFKETQVAHAYLFCGPRGTGKTSAARLIAKALNCLSLKKSGEPCDACEMCQAVKDNRLMDIIEIDAASNRGIDEIRDLREKIKFSPTQGAKKVFIIDEVHMLTKEAFNALLKTLEEPPAHAHLILATTESHKVPATIISRCQHFDFKRIDEETCIKRLDYIAHQEGIKAESEALVIISKACDGSMRDAIGLLEQMTISKKLTKDRVQLNLGLVDHQIIADFSQLILAKKTKEAIEYVGKMYTEGIDLLQIIREVKEHLRQEMLNFINNDQKTEALSILHIINKLEQVSNELKNASIPQLPLELMLVELGLNNPAEIVAKKEPQPVQKPKTADKPKEPEAPTVSESVADLSLALLRENWGKILTNIKIPTLNLALHKAKLESLKGDNLVISVTSEFELERISSKTAKHELETKIQEAVGKTVLVKFILKEAPKVEPEPEKEVEIKTADPVQDVANFFEGEVVEPKK